MAAHQQAGEHAWMYPLTVLAGLLRRHAVWLEKCMGCEDLGFDEIERRSELRIFCPACEQGRKEFLRRSRIDPLPPSA